MAVFVDGCFWHRCPIHATEPKANGAWWAQKLKANVERDRRIDAQLDGLGWKVIRVWEHESPTTAAVRISSVIKASASERTREEIG